ncbi:putative HAT dimerization domain, ribonuclease H-like superfamily [Helianthus anomalus]
MREKFKKYFKEIPPVVTCASAINPTINVTGVETLIESIVDDLNLHEEDPFFSRNAKKDFNKAFQNMFDHYLNKYGSKSNIHESMASGSSSGNTSRNPILSLYNTLRNENSKRTRGNTPSSELGRYIGTDFISTLKQEEFENFNILAWWQGRKSQYPVLAAMARDLLTVQASTVASESAFSLSGRVLSIRRTRLTPESVEMCICLKDHLDAAERVQDVAKLEGELDIEQEIHEYEVDQEATSPLSDEEEAYDEAYEE